MTKRPERRTAVVTATLTQNVGFPALADALGICGLAFAFGTWAAADGCAGAGA